MAENPATGTRGQGCHDQGLDASSRGLGVGQRKKYGDDDYQICIINLKDIALSGQDINTVRNYCLLLEYFLSYIKTETNRAFTGIEIVI